jgi:hypothetical protein
MTYNNILSTLSILIVAFVFSMTRHIPKYIDIAQEDMQERIRWLQQDLQDMSNVMKEIHQAQRVVCDSPMQTSSTLPCWTSVGFPSGLVCPGRKSIHCDENLTTCTTTCIDKE